MQLHGERSSLQSLPEYKRPEDEMKQRCLNPFYVITSISSLFKTGALQHEQLHFEPFSKFSFFSYVLR